MNQFEIKDACIEFVFNNVSAHDNDNIHGNNDIKIKLNLKVEKIC